MQFRRWFKLEERFMSRNLINEESLAARLIDTKSRIFLELTNLTDHTLRSIEIVTVFLKDDETSTGRDAAKIHIRFDGVRTMPARQTAVLSHRTWIDGRPANSDEDQMEQLRIIAGKVKPYVLDISWKDADGKSCSQRIPIGH
jgi:hypothetical protein